MVDFAIKDCALNSIATGRRAQTLRELRDILRDVHPGSIYHHFWGTLLRTRFLGHEYNNDFAAWCYRCLHDNPAAERLAVIDPAHYDDIEDLRRELIDVIEGRLDETELMLFARADQQFHFVRSVTVVFDTSQRLAHPAELRTALPAMSASSVFYHFIDARRRQPSGLDDFRSWMLGLGPKYDAVCDDLAGVDPYFESLFVLRGRLTALFERHFGDSSPQEEDPDRPSTITSDSAGETASTPTLRSM